MSSQPSKPSSTSHLDPVDEVTGLSHSFQDNFLQFTPDNGFEKLPTEFPDTEHPIYDRLTRESLGTVTLKLEIFVFQGDDYRFLVSGWFNGSAISVLTASMNSKGHFARNAQDQLRFDTTVVAAMGIIEVSNKFEGLGVGRAMVERLLGQARREGATLSSVRPGDFRKDGYKNTSLDGRPRAVAFWEAMGYVKEDLPGYTFPRHLKRL